MTNHKTSKMACIFPYNFRSALKLWIYICGWCMDVYHRVLSCIKHTNSDSKCLKRDRQMCEQFVYTHALYICLACVCVEVLNQFRWNVAPVVVVVAVFSTVSPLLPLPHKCVCASATNCFWQTVFLNPEWEKINYHRWRVLIVKCADHKNRFN